MLELVQFLLVLLLCDSLASVYAARKIKRRKTGWAGWIEKFRDIWSVRIHVNDNQRIRGSNKDSGLRSYFRILFADYVEPSSSANDFTCITKFFNWRFYFHRSVLWWYSKFVKYLKIIDLLPMDAGWSLNLFPNCLNYFLLWSIKEAMLVYKTLKWILDHFLKI